MLSSKDPYLLDICISADQNVYPMVAPGAAINDIIDAIDLTIGGVRPTEDDAAHSTSAHKKAGNER